MDPRESPAYSLQGAAGDGRLSAEDLRANFLWFAALFGINHGVVTVPLVLSSSMLDSSVAYVGNALLYVCTMVAALFLAAPCIGQIGVKSTLLLSMLLYCVYSGLFALSVIAGPTRVGIQYQTFCVGSLLGGCGAGMLWTAQGGYFASTVDAILQSQPESTTRGQLSAQFAATFAVIYLACEVVAKLAWFALAYAGLGGWAVATVYCVVGVLSLLKMTRIRDFNAKGISTSWTSKFQATISLWADPALILISGSNFTFGFSAAFMNGYVNANFTVKQLGTPSVALMAALTTCTGALFSSISDPLSAAYGKSSVVVIASACFVSISVFFIAFDCCEGWRWGLVVPYLFQGIGRAVYESTNRAIFDDFFPHDSEGAFANCMMQSTTAFALCFFLSEYLQGPVLEKIIMSLAILTPAALAMAHLQRGPAARCGEAGERSRISAA